MKFLGLCAGIFCSLSIVAATAEESTLAASHDLGIEGGRQCMLNHQHSGSGMGATKPAARLSAIRSWADFTDFEYGRRWASFSVAAGSATRYSKEASGWSATVDARPCKR